MTREPTYGVPKTSEQLTTQDPCAVAYGVTPSNEFIPLKIDSTGRLEIAAEVTLDASDIEIGAVEIKNYNSDDRVFISPAHEILAQARMYDAAGTGLTSTLVTGKQSLDVNLVNSLDDEDNSIPGGLTRITTANLLYGYDGIDWERLKSLSGRLIVDGSQVTQPISAASLPLPSGAATEATLGLIKTNTDSLDVSLSSRASETTLLAVKTDLDKFTFVSTRLLVDGSGVTQPVSGTVNVGNFPATQNVNVTNASLAVTQSGAWSVTANIGSTGGLALDSTLSGIKAQTDQFTFTGGSLNVSVTSGTFTLSHNTDSILIYGNDGVLDRVIKTDAAGELQVDVVSSALPTGAATETTLAFVKSNTDELDVALSTRASETTLAGIKTQTDKLTFTATRLLVDGSGVTQPVSGSVTANIGTTGGLLLDATFTGRINTLGQKTMAASTPVVLASDQSTLNVSVQNATLAVTQSGVWSVGRTWTLTSGTDSVSAVQSGTWNINNITGTVSLPTGAATEATLLAIKTDADKFTFASTRLLVDGSGVTQPVSGSVSVSNFPAVQTVAISQTSTNNNVDVIDRVAREDGRVSASDSVIISETFSTSVNTYANARPVNGDMVVRHYKTKKIYVKNTSANAGRLEIFGSVDNGANFDVTVAPDAALNAGVTSITDLQDALTHIQIQVRSQNNGQTTTYVSKAYAMGV